MLFLLSNTLFYENSSNRTVIFPAESNEKETMVAMSIIEFSKQELHIVDPILLVYCTGMHMHTRIPKSEGSTNLVIDYINHY